MKTIQSALKEATGQLQGSSDSPALDAEVLLCLILQKQRSYLRAWPEQLLTEEQNDQFRSLVEKRKNGHPVAYLTGLREFWSRDFLVTPDVLIPRPETELLVEICLELIQKNQYRKIVDLGTGSGIIAVTLAAERPDIDVTATDLSDVALAIARQNAQRFHVGNLHFYHSHWFDDLEDSTFDLVVSNPPYIAEGDPHLQQGDLRFEPDESLISERQGLGCIETIVDTARNHIQSGGYLLIEHGFEQQQQVQKIFKQNRYTNVHTHTDLSGQPRVTLGQKNA